MAAAAPGPGGGWWRLSWVAAFSAWRVERQVGKARLELRLAEAAIAGQDFGQLAERAPVLLSLAARHAAGEGRWREVAALYEDHAAHLPPALLEAAEVELGLNRAVDEEAPAEEADGEVEPEVTPSNRRPRRRSSGVCAGRNSSMPRACNNCSSIGGAGRWGRSVMTVR